MQKRVIYECVCICQCLSLQMPNYPPTYLCNYVYTNTLLSRTSKVFCFSLHFCEWGMSWQLLLSQGLFSGNILVYCPSTSVLYIVLNEIRWGNVFQMKTKCIYFYKFLYFNIMQPTIWQEIGAFLFFIYFVN